MVRKEDILAGRSLRTLSDSFAVPAGTLATVSTVGTTWQGEFVFTVRWLNVNTGTQLRPISDRSLNLWEADLLHFEAVSREEGGAVKAAPLVHPKRTLPVRGHRGHRKSKNPNSGQLRLFTLEDF